MTSVQQKRVPTADKSPKNKTRPLRATGTIWLKRRDYRRRLVRNVVRRLERDFGLPRFGNPYDPIDDLVYIVISNRTGPTVARATYESVKQQYPDWNELLSGGARKLRKLLQPAGLASVKSSQIARTFKRIVADFGILDISPLAMLPPAECEAYLASLPGVSTKVAKCVMLYTLGFHVLPVDVHTHRVAKRLGWTAHTRPHQAHDELEALILPPLRYSFHVCSVALGRTLCRATAPKCESCPIRRQCSYAKQSKAKNVEGAPRK